MSKIKPVCQIWPMELSSALKARNLVVGGAVAAAIWVVAVLIVAPKLQHHEPDDMALQAGPVPLNQVSWTPLVYSNLIFVLSVLCAQLKSVP